jgi:hypothetical protein
MNVLNKQSRTADKGWSSSFGGFGERLVARCYTGPWNWPAPMNTLMNLRVL